MRHPQQHHIPLLPRHCALPIFRLEAGPPAQAIQHRRDILRFVVEESDDDFIAADFREGIEKGAACSWEGTGWVGGCAGVLVGVGFSVLGDEGEEAGDDVVDENGKVWIQELRPFLERVELGCEVSSGWVRWAEEDVLGE